MSEIKISLLDKIFSLASDTWLKQEQCTRETVQALHQELRLYLETEAAKNNAAAILYVDGAARGNPGPAGIGMVLTDARGKTISEKKLFIGAATNNVAEYQGLIHGLDFAFKKGIQKLLVRTDSELMAKQMLGQFRVKNPQLLVLYDQATALANQFQEFAIEHVPREANRRTDILANMAIDQRWGQK